MPDEPSEEKKPSSQPTGSPLTGRSEPNLPPHLRAQMQNDEAAAAEIARTKLDYDAVGDVVSQTVAKREEQVAEMLLNPSQAAKPCFPINDFKAATPCSARTDSKERVGFCEKCHCRFYDFTGMEMPEAEELIFKMEGLKEFQLFKRGDGKFLTKDCPVGKKLRMMRYVALGAGAIAIVCIALVSFMAPQPTMELQQQVSNDGNKTAGGAEPESTDAKTDESKGSKKPLVIRHHYK